MSTIKVQRERTEHYQQSVDEVLAALDTDARRGLSEGEARARLERYGRNELTVEKPVPAWRKLLAQFQDVLVILLLIATLLSAGLWLYERPERKKRAIVNARVSRSATHSAFEFHLSRCDRVVSAVLGRVLMRSASRTLFNT